MSYFLYYLAAIAVLNLSPMPVEAGSHKGVKLETNAQRFAKGLPPKPIALTDPRSKRAIRPRQSPKPPPAPAPIKQTRSVKTPGGSCGCSYTVLTNTAVTFSNPGYNLEVTETKASWDECLTWGDRHASCWSVTFDGETGLCSVWNDEPERNMRLVANNYYAVYNTGASECDYRSCDIQ